MHLARMGAGKVLLLEKGHLAGGATGRSGAMVREHYLHPTLVKMAMEASDIFHNFGDAVGGDARFTETGRLLLFGERDEAAVRANVEMNRALGVDIRILTPSEASDIVPQVSTDGVALGVFEPTAGYADPMATTYAFADQARNRGSEILTGCAVTGIKVAGGRVTGVETQDGLIETDAVVAATGPWANQLAAPLGETLPISPIRVQTIHLRRPPSLESLRTIIIDRTTGTYLRVTSGFNTLVGGEAFEDLNEVVNPGRIRPECRPRHYHAILGSGQGPRSRIPSGDADGRIRFAVRHDAGRQSGPGLFGGRRGTVLGGGLQWTRIQAVPGSGPDGGGAGVARREQRPPDSRFPRKSFYRGRPSGRRVSL